MSKEKSMLFSWLLEQFVIPLKIPIYYSTTAWSCMNTISWESDDDIYIHPNKNSLKYWVDAWIAKHAPSRENLLT